MLTQPHLTPPTSPQAVTGHHMVYGSLVLRTLQNPINIAKFTQGLFHPATPHPSYFTTGRHRPPHGLRVTGLNNPPKADKYRKIHTRSFSGYDQQLPNNLGEEERTRPQTATPPLGLQQNTSSRLKSPLNHAHSSCPNLSLFELACQTSPRPICASCANKRNLQHPLKRS